MLVRRVSLLKAEMAVGGHDKTFVLPPPLEVLCKSCELVAKIPCKTQCDCRGIYCSGCASNFDDQCQVCNKSVQPVNDIVMAHRISTLPVKCDNVERGCVWIGDLGQLDTHLLSCPQQKTNCPYKRLGCNMTLPRNEMDHHDELYAYKHLHLAMQYIERLDGCVHTPPVVFKLNDFDIRFKLNHNWHSPPFYTHPGGYRMCVSMNVRGDGMGRGTHSSLYVCLMQGCNDNHLTWPFRGEVTLQLLNQLQDGGHKQETIHFTNSSMNEVNSRVRGRDKCTQGRGLQLFIPHSKLGTDEATQKCYLKNDCLYIRVSCVVVYTSNTPWLTPTLSTTAMMSNT